MRDITVTWTGSDVDQESGGPEVRHFLPHFLDFSGILGNVQDVFGVMGMGV